MTTKQATAEDIAAIISGKPASSLASLPAVWRAIAKGSEGQHLSAHARADYIEAAKLFQPHGTPLGVEALSAIGYDFVADRYPDFDALEGSLGAAMRDLFSEFGYDVPASFYNVILKTKEETQDVRLFEMFKDKKRLMQDRLADAVLHAMLLVTPLGLRVQSILSRHGLRFVHVMNCGCQVIASADAPFDITLDPALKPAYLQNMIAASFEQYGVNAVTSGSVRGF